MSDRPEGCTDLVRLVFLCPDPGFEKPEEDYQSTLEVAAEDHPMYAAAPQMLAALEVVVRDLNQYEQVGANAFDDVLTAIAKARGE